MQSGLDDFSPPTCVRKCCFCAPSLSRVESTAQQRKYVVPPPPEKLVLSCAGGPAVLRGASDGWQLASIHRSQLLQLQAGPCSVQGGARCNNIPERGLRCAARTDTHHGEVSSCCLGAASRAGQHYGHVCVTARRIMVQLYSSAWQPRQTSIERTSGLLFVGRGKPDALPVPATVSLFVDPYRARCAVLQAEVLHFFVDSHEQAASSQAGTTEAG